MIGTVSSSPHDIVVTMPVFNDWSALRILLPALDDALGAAGLSARVVVVDDASSEPAPANLVVGPYFAIRRIEILRLRCNLGHQRAIAVALTYIAEYATAATVVVMDSDGQDAPSDVP